MDFTIKIYRKLINTLINQGFSFLSFDRYILNPKKKSIILRHDVDALPANSLYFAKILADMQIRGTFYFRIVPQCYNEKIIKAIYSLGHEIGYHYEDVGSVSKEFKYLKHEEDIIKIAIESFIRNLEIIRSICPVNTICMHGNPLNKWDSRTLWKYFDYHNFGIIGEPYFDINFNEVYYLTDTGRRWNGDSVNLRDRTFKFPLSKEISRRSLMLGRSEHNPFSSLKYNSTYEIIEAAEKGNLPDKIMFTFHPQRWFDQSVPWAKELIWQNIKNVGKYFLFYFRITTK